LEKKKKTKQAKEVEKEFVVKRLKTIIKSLPDIAEDERGNFRSGNRKVWLNVGRRKVTVNPTDYWYDSVEQVKQEEFELKGAIEDYLKHGYPEPRLRFEERKENGKSMLHCMMSGVMSGVEIKLEFRPKWYELLNGVTRMVFTEYKNAKITKKDRMQDILKSLRKITRYAERHCRELGYPV
jgi:hypothetical protein